MLAIKQSKTILSDIHVCLSCQSVNPTAEQEIKWKASFRSLQNIFFSTNSFFYLNLIFLHTSITITTGKAKKQACPHCQMRKKNYMKLSTYTMLWDKLLNDCCRFRWPFSFHGVFLSSTSCTEERTFPRLWRRWKERSRIHWQIFVWGLIHLTDCTFEDPWVWIWRKIFA